MKRSNTDELFAIWTWSQLNQKFLMLLNAFSKPSVVEYFSDLFA